MKSQFQSDETLRIRLLPFVNKTTGDYVTSGLDTCTLTIKRPDGTLLPGGPHLATWDTDVHIWVFDVTVGSFQQGEWRVKAVSNEVDSLPRWANYVWGDYVDVLDTLNTKLGTPAGASVSADIASVQSSASSAATNAASAATNASTAATNASTAATNAATAATAASAAQTAATAAAADALSGRKVSVNRWKIQGTQLLVYEDNGSTVFKAFDLKDDLGNPSATRIFERVPV